jgi:hypothetical protein
MKKAPEQNRITTGNLGSDSSYGNNGVFVFTKFFDGKYREITCIVSDGKGWEHVSVTVALKNGNPMRCATWEEMCFVKDQFWNRDEAVVQFHPPESDYINNHPFCLHLWKPSDREFRLPPANLVGFKQKNNG